MDRIAKIRIVRTSDNKEFEIGLFGVTSCSWCFLKKGLDGFGSFEKEIEFVDSAIGDGGSNQSSRISSKDRTIRCAYIYPDINDIERDSAKRFFQAHEIYKVYITYGRIS